MNTAIVGIICGIGGFIISFLGYFRNSKSDIKEETGSTARVEMKLDYAITGINEIKADMKDTQKDVIEISTRLTKVEDSLKSAHHRIDELKE